MIEDNGKGFDPETVPPDGRHGLGLVGIVERAAECDGTFRLDPAPGRGTTLTVELPALLRTTQRPDDLIAAAPGSVPEPAP